MRFIDRIRKPEYFFRPGLLVTRLTRSIDSKPRVFTPSWKLSLSIDPTEEIGKALVQMGVCDLPVSETIWRLLDPHERAVDVGANIGYMSSIMAAKTGPRGYVTAFEPHPELFSTLEGNIGRWRKFGIDGVRAHRAALSNRVGHGSLHIPEGFDKNRGLASLSEDIHKTDVPVDLDQLDGYVSALETVALLKVDVEGHELQVFQGSETLLSNRCVRDIVFEEFGEYPTPVTSFLEQHGYTLYHLGMTFWGPMLSKGNGAALGRREWTASSMLATCDPDRARKRLAPRGWHILRPKIDWNAV